jgi:2-polyprenyl-3-methyl-5-hydroxy-6-metoxy-1,4-benzoquinol methylase
MQQRSSNRCLVPARQHMKGSAFNETGYRTASELKKLVTIIRWAEERRCAVAGQRLHVLELGCGTGSISLPLASLGFDVLGTDVDRTSVARAAEHNNFGHAQFRMLDLLDSAALTALPEFEIVICSEVIQYLPDPLRALHQMRKLVRRPGYLILTTPNAWGSYALLSEALWRARSALRLQLQRHGLLEAVHGMRDGRVALHAERERPSLNASMPRPRFLSPARLQHLLWQTGFIIREWNNSDFLWLGGLRRNPWLAALDCGVADHLPRSVASGWYLKCQ